MCSGSADILRYVRRENGPAAVHKAGPAADTTDAVADWLDDDDEEILSSEDLTSLECRVSSPKKPKIC